MVVFMFEHSSMFVWIWIMLLIAFGKGVYRFVRSKGDFSSRITAVKEEYFAKDFEGLSTSVIFLGLALLFLFSYLLFLFIMIRLWYYYMKPFNSYDYRESERGSSELF